MLGLWIFHRLLGGGVWTPPPPWSRLLVAVEKNERKRSKAHEKSFRNHFGHFLAQVKIEVTRVKIPKFLCCVWPFGSAFLGVRVRACLNTWNRGAGGAGYLSHNEAGVAGRATDAWLMVTGVRRWSVPRPWKVLPVGRGGHPATALFELPGASQKGWRSESTSRSASEWLQ